MLTNNWQKNAVENQKKYARFLKTANKNKVLPQLPQLHDKAFENINCLQCAACCKNYSPRFKSPDIRRIAKHLRIKETEMVRLYLKVDSDEDYVTKQTPCPFLGAGNACTIYDVRPSDCARFPYTNEDVLLKRPTITLKNATFCPAVYTVLEALTK